MVTSKDVAKYAGVSRATVSAVINKNKFVSKQLTKRVKRAIRELNYRPNAIARSLKLKKTHTIGLVIHNITSPFWPPVVKAIENYLAKDGYNIILGSTDEDPDKERVTLEVLREKQVDGIILMPAGNKNKGYIQEIVNSRLPLVFLDRGIDGVDTHIVGIDHYRGAYNAVRHLIASNHRRIGIVSFPVHIISSAERVEGYKRALKDCDIPIDQSLIKIGDFTEESGYEKTLELLAMRKPPDALFTCNHLLTVGALKAIKEKKLRIPKDIALIGFDDLPWTSCFDPPLTMIAQPTHALGVAAAKIMIESLKYKKRMQKSKKLILEPKLIVRESCGCRKDSSVHPRSLK